MYILYYENIIDIDNTYLRLSVINIDIDINIDIEINLLYPIHRKLCFILLRLS